MKKVLSLVMIVMLGFMLVGCSTDNDATDSGEVTTFAISIYDEEGSQLYHEEISTTEASLFDALVASDQIEIGYESSQFGNFITTINGIDAEDGYFWGFFVDGEMSMVGPESHTVEDDDQIQFRLESY